MKIIITINIMFLKKNHVNNIKILYYSRVEVSGSIDVNKTSVSEESIICHYWHFLDKGFKFQPSVLEMP